MPTRLTTVASLLLTITFLVFSQAPTAQATEASFTPLGYLPPGPVLPVRRSSFANAISGDGSTVVGYSHSSNGSREAFRWTAAEGMVGLGDLPGGNFESRAYGVNADGSIIGGFGNIDDLLFPQFSQREAFLWNATDGMLGVRFDPPGFFSPRLLDLSDNGLKAVGTNGPDALIWDVENSTTTLLENLPGTSRATGISTDGTYVAGDGPYPEGGAGAFIWDATNGIVGLGDLPGGLVSSNALGISADGSTIVGTSRGENGDEAFLWTVEHGMIGLGGEPEWYRFTRATAVSGDGSIIVGEGLGEFGSEAMVWDAHNGKQNIIDLLLEEGLDMDGWQLQAATGISDDGRTIVGYGRNPSGDIEAWVATVSLVPEPTAFTLLGTLIVLFSAGRRLAHASSMAEP